jgi:hypothetical protein
LPPRQRSRVGNGNGLLPRGLADERSAWARRLKDCIADHLSDLADATAAERSIIRRAATLTVELERLEARFAAAGEATTPIWRCISAAAIRCAACSKASASSAAPATCRRR